MNHHCYSQGLSNNLAFTKQAIAVTFIEFIYLASVIGISRHLYCFSISPEILSSMKVMVQDPGISRFLDETYSTSVIIAKH